MNNFILLSCMSALVASSYAMLQGPHVPIPQGQITYGATPALMRYALDEVSKRSGSCTRVCTSSRINPDHSIAKAIKDGNITEVKKYFNSWQRFIMSWQDHDYEVAQTLKYAATCESKNVQSIITFLLTQIKPEYIEEPTCLLRDAELHNHTNLIDYLSLHFPELFAKSNNRLTMIDTPTQSYRKASADELGYIVMGIVLCPPVLLTPLILCCTQEKEKPE